MEKVSLSSDTFQTRYPRKLASLGMSCLPCSLTKLCVTAIQSPKQLIRDAQLSIDHVHDNLVIFNAKLQFPHGRHPQKLITKREVTKAGVPIGNGSSTQELASGFSGRLRTLAASDSRSASASRSITDDSGLSW